MDPPYWSRNAVFLACSAHPPSSVRAAATAHSEMSDLGGERDRDRDHIHIIGLYTTSIHMHARVCARTHTHTHTHTRTHTHQTCNSGGKPLEDRAQFYFERLFCARAHLVVNLSCLCFVHFCANPL